MALPIASSTRSSCERSEAAIAPLRLAARVTTRFCDDLNRIAEVHDAHKLVGIVLYLDERRSVDLAAQQVACEHTPQSFDRSSAGSFGVRKFLPVDVLGEPGAIAEM